MISFVTATSSAFHALTPKDNDALYFLTDTNQIYKGGTLYTGKISLVAAFPAKGAEGVLYVLTTTLEAKIWQDGAWEQVAKPYTTTVTESSEDLPTSKAVAAYVLAQIQEAIGSGGVVSGLSYVSKDAETNNGIDDRDIIVTKGDGTSDTIHLANLVSSVEYDSTNLVLTFRLSCVEEPIVVNLPKDNFVTSGTYNTTTKNIELTLKDGSKILIPASDLVDVYTGGETSTASVAVSASNVVTANVKISDDAGNIIETKTDGLFASVDISGKMNTLGAGNADQILLSDAAGQAKRSGKAIGGATLASTPNANTVATEAAVNAIIQVLQGSINTLSSQLDDKVNNSAITQSINAASPSANKIPSESAIVTAMSWKTI